MSAFRPATQAATTTPAGRVLLLAALAIAIIGAGIGATEPIRAMLQGAVLGAVYEVVSASSSRSDVLGVTLIVTGVLLLLFGIAFRHGRSLAEEAEGLV